ncbi:trypsin zeta-like [Musca domestica]|uniref:Trypsin n=1 Tax=Musca domestica TaxID=7370 RepID=T1PGJ2_MUSDO|nr:trypsin zeta-like [Musca domestica]XP_058984782.1 trypsin zeta-like [Musca domestica]
MSKLSVCNILLLTILAHVVVGQPLKDEELAPNVNQDGRIVGGYAVDITKHPHQISMRRKSCEDCTYTHSCGGSIYKADVIVTAAHCVNGRVAENFIIVAGTSTRNGVDGAVSRVKKIVMHEKYNSSVTDNDVALMFLATPLPLDGIKMAPIELASEVPVHGSKCTISGWGTTSSGGVSSNQLLAVDVPIVDNERCDAAYGPGRITDAMLCAGVEGVGGKDACQGDSGGPLLVNGKLAGIVSWGRSCALPDYPGVYANVPYLREWILENVAANV